MPGDDVIREELRPFDVAATCEELERADANVTGRDTGQHGARESLLAEDFLACSPGRDSRSRRNPKLLHRLPHEVLPEHRPERCPAVATPRKGRGPGSLELNIVPHPCPIDHL